MEGCQSSSQYIERGVKQRSALFLLSGHGAPFETDAGIGDVHNFSIITSALTHSHNNHLVAR